uniref:SGTA homodimerisation domain-containing protein n=1 Tax=Globodera rostochiensis TaxID=31243 RepID=A0A914GW27_GLORO
MQSEEKQKGRVTNDERNLVVSFIQFLRQKVSSNQCTDDQIEGLEVAVQCLETAFSVSDKNYAFQPSKPLTEIFKAAEGLPDGDEELPTPTQAEIQKSNTLKEEGNELVKANKHEEAILKYNEAIKLNRDPIFFCNRAAAYCRLEQYDLAIQDCRTALALDPNYAKAYGRMGVALSCQNRYDHAVEAYKKALEIDPGNESYKNNLSIAEDKLRQAQEAFANNPQPNPFANMFGGPGGLGGLMNNPEIVNTFSNMLQDPNMRNMMSQMMQSLNQGQGGPAGANGFSEMLRAGAAIAQTMEQANPELVDVLRRQFGGGGGGGTDGPPGGNQNNGQQPPPGSG